MNFLKKLTLLSSAIGLVIITSSGNIVFGDSLGLKLSRIVSRAIKTGVMDFTSPDIDNLTARERSVMIAGVNAVLRYPNLEDLTVIGRRGICNTEENPDLGRLSLLFRNHYPQKLAFDIADQIMKLDVRPPNLMFPFDDKKDKYFRQQMMKSIDVAYESGYIDFSKTMNFVDAKVSKTKCTKTTLYASLFELGFNLDLGGGRDFCPIKVIVKDDSALKTNGVSSLKEFLKEYFDELFEFTTKNDAKKKYLEMFFNYMKKNNVIDLTALDLDSFSEADMDDFIEKVNEVINEDTHLIYYKSMGEYLKKELSMDCWESIKDVVTNRHEIKYEDRYTIMEQLSFLSKTKSIILDNISFPVISKIRFYAFHRAVAGKKDKLKIKVYADFSKNENLKKMLEEDPNIEVEFGEFDMGVYENLQLNLVSAIPTGEIDISNFKLKSKNKGLFDLVKAGVEYYLANHLLDEKIDLAVEVPYSADGEENLEIFEKFRKLKKKYKNLNVIKRYI